MAKENTECYKCGTAIQAEAYATHPLCSTCEDDFAKWFAEQTATFSPAGKPITAWVSDDGSYGAGDLLTFDPDRLTDSQWDTLGELSDYSRIDYVQAILNGDDLSEWEN